MKAYTIAVVANSQASNESFQEKKKKKTGTQEAMLLMLLEAAEKSEGTQCLNRQRQALQNFINGKDTPTL